MDKTKFNLDKDVEIKEVIEVPERINTFPDKKTGVKSVAFPFQFPSGANGIITITHLDNMPWQPSTDIDTITIKFKNHS